jgi:hypothetical protein
VVVLSLVWSDAIRAVLLKLFWLPPPKWLAAAIALIEKDGTTVIIASLPTTGSGNSVGTL